MTTLLEALALTPVSAEVYQVQLHFDWSQGRTQFGGIVAGLAATAVARRAGPDHPLRSLALAD